jgi:uncharacterized protein YodC (DUF2158 family)
MVNKHEFEKLEHQHQAIVAALFRLCDPSRTMENFKSGDTVQLKSGGPTMTIHTVNSDGSMFCQWFDKGDVLKQGEFQPAQLKKAEPRDNGPYVA